LSLVSLEGSELKAAIKSLKEEMQAISKEKADVESKVTEILLEYNKIKQIFEQEVSKKNQISENLE